MFPGIVVSEGILNYAHWMGSLALDLQMGVVPASRLRSHYGEWVSVHQPELARICASSMAAGSLNSVVRFFSPGRSQQDQVRLPRLREAALAVYGQLTGHPNLNLEDAIYRGVGHYPSHLANPWELHEAFLAFPAELQEALKHHARIVSPRRSGEAVTVDWSPHLMREAAVSIAGDWIGKGCDAEGRPLMLLGPLFNWIQTTPVKYQDKLLTGLAESEPLRASGRMKAVMGAVNRVNELTGSSLRLHTIVQPSPTTGAGSVYRLSQVTADPTLHEAWTRIIPEPEMRKKILCASGFTETVLLSSQNQLAAGMARAIICLSPVGDISVSVEETRMRLRTLGSLLDLFLDDHPAVPQAHFFSDRLCHAGMDRLHQSALCSLLSSQFGRHYQQPSANDYRMEISGILPVHPDDPHRNSIATHAARRRRLFDDLKVLRSDILARTSIPKLKKKFLPRLMWSRCALLEVAIQFPELATVVRDLDGCLEGGRVGMDGLVAIVFNIQQVFEKHETAVEPSPGLEPTALNQLPQEVQTALRALVTRVGRRVYRTEAVAADPAYDDNLFRWLVAEWLADALVMLYTQASAADRVLSDQVDEVLSWLSRAPQAAMFTVARFLIKHPWIHAQGQMKGLALVLDNYNRRFDRGYEIKMTQVPVSDEPGGKTRLSAVVRKNEPNAQLLSHFRGDEMTIATLTDVTGFSRTFLLSDRGWPDGFARAIAALEPLTRNPETEAGEKAVAAIAKILSLFAGPKACLEGKSVFDSRLETAGLPVTAFHSLVSRINEQFGSFFVVSNRHLASLSWDGSRGGGAFVKRLADLTRSRRDTERWLVAASKAQEAEARVLERQRLREEKKKSREAAAEQKRQATEARVLERQKLREEKQKSREVAAEQKRQATEAREKRDLPSDFAVGAKVSKKGSGRGVVVGIKTLVLGGHPREFYQVRFKHGVMELVPKTRASECGLRGIS